MKEIKAFIRPEKFDEVYLSLKEKGICYVTVTECEGTGKYSDSEKADFPSAKIPYMHSKIFKLEIVCKDSDADNIVEIIREKGRTGKQGDGMIYVIDVKDAVHIRTGLKNDMIMLLSIMK